MFSSQTWASRSGDVIRQVLNRIEAVNAQVNPIATAAEEQTSTTCEIAGNMNKITQVVHKNSQGAKESSLSAYRLSELAAGLQITASRFKIA
jgi:methyl-accepting chemotaxis protein